MHLAVSLVCFIVGVPPFGTFYFYFSTFWSLYFYRFLRIIVRFSRYVFQCICILLPSAASAFPSLTITAPFRSIPVIPLHYRPLHTHISAPLFHSFARFLFVDLPRTYRLFAIRIRSVASRCFQNLSIFWNYRFNGKGIRRSFLFARNTVVSSAETCSTVKEQKGNCLLATYYFYTMDRCCSKNVEFENLILCTLNISTMSTTLTYFRSENVEKKFERNWKEI